MNQSERSELWRRLVDAGVAEGQAPDATSNTSPWYVRVMLGAAGWLGALFGLGFLIGTFAFLFESERLALPAGVMLCAGAYGLYRAAPANDFVSQLAFAVSLAGQCLVVFGLFVVFGGELDTPTLLLVLAAFEFALLVLPDFVHRAWCALAGALLTHVGLAMYGLEILSLAVIAAGFALAFLQDHRWPEHIGLLQPVGAALGIALAVMHLALGAGAVELVGEVFWNQEHWGIWLPAWSATAVLTVILGAAIYLIAAKANACARTKTLALAGLFAVAAVTHNAPGIMAALLIAVVGFAVSNRFAVGLGIAALLGYLSHFYYSLEQTLLHKSITLVVSGAVLIALWWLIGRLFGQPDPSHTHGQRTKAAGRADA